MQAMLRLSLLSLCFPILLQADDFAERCRAKGGTPLSACTCPDGQTINPWSPYENCSSRSTTETSCTTAGGWMDPRQTGSNACTCPDGYHPDLTRSENCTAHRSRTTSGLTLTFPACRDNKASAQASYFCPQGSASARVTNMTYWYDRALRDSFHSTSPGTAVSNTFRSEGRAVNETETLVVYVSCYNSNHQLIESFQSDISVNCRNSGSERSPYLVELDRTLTPQVSVSSTTATAPSSPLAIAEATACTLEKRQVLAFACVNGNEDWKCSNNTRCQLPSGTTEVIFSSPLSEQNIFDLRGCENEVLECSDLE